MTWSADGRWARKHHETWEQKEKTGFATRILSNPDLLLWHAQAKGDVSYIIPLGHKVQLGRADSLRIDAR
jgi:hypothetical protein